MPWYQQFVQNLVKYSSHIRLDIVKHESSLGELVERVVLNGTHGHAIFHNLLQKTVGFARFVATSGLSPGLSVAFILTVITAIQRQLDSRMRQCRYILPPLLTIIFPSLLTTGLAVNAEPP